MSALGSDGFSRQNAPVEHFERVSELLCSEGRTNAHRPRLKQVQPAVGNGLPALTLFLVTLCHLSKVYDINSDLSILKSDFSDKKLLITKDRETVLNYSHGRLKQQSRLYPRKKRRTQRRATFSTVCCYKKCGWLGKSDNTGGKTKKTS